MDINKALAVLEKQYRETGIKPEISYIPATKIRDITYLDTEEKINYYCSQFNGLKYLEDYVNFFSSTSSFRNAFYKISPSEYYLFSIGKWDKCDSNKFRSWLSKKASIFLDECLLDEYGGARNKINIKHAESIKKKLGDLNNVQKSIALDNPSLYSDFNKIKDVLVFNNNKYYNMRTKKIKTTNPEIRITHRLNYDNNIMNLTEKDEYVLNYFKSLFGCVDTAKALIDVIYTAMSGNTMRYFFAFWGYGRNGKSLLLRLINDIFGEWVSPISNKVFIEQKYKSQLSEEMVLVCEKRIGYFSEPPRNSAMCEDTLKAITGGDNITVRDLYKGTYKDKPTATLFLACNTPPELSQDPAVKDRMIGFYFCNRFEHKHEYETELKAHYPYILSYILRTGKIIDNPLITENMRKATEYINTRSDIVEQYLLNSSDYTRDEEGVFNQAIFKQDITAWANYSNLTYAMKEKLQIVNLYPDLENKGFKELPRTRNILKPRKGLKRNPIADSDDYTVRFG